jgi:hypothetical protein
MLSLTLRKEIRLMLFKSRMLWKIFGPKRDEVTRKWRKVHIWSFMICTAHQIIQVIMLRRMRWAIILVEKPEVNIQKGKPKYRM